MTVHSALAGSTAGPTTAEPLLGTWLIGADQPWRPDSQEATSLLHDELSRIEYRESLWSRFQEWLSGVLRVPEGLQNAWLGNTLMIVAALALLALLGYAVRRGASTRRSTGYISADLLGDRPRSAAEHRRLAQEALQASDHANAVLHAFRAIVTTAVERRIVAVGPAHTADEAAELLAAAYPLERGELRTASDTFDGIRYGGRIPVPAQSQHVLDLEQRLRHAPTTNPRHGVATIGTGR